MPKTILITGASSGIGYELAKRYAADGCDLVLIARTKFKLEHLATEISQEHDITVHIIPADLSHPDTPQHIYAECMRRDLHIHTVINNAGFGLYGEFASSNLMTELSMIDLNVKALTEMTKLFLPNMIAEKSGHIVNIASTAAFQPGPRMAVYYASKAYVLNFSEAVREELRDTGVAITTVCPGPTKTGFEDAADMAFPKTMKVMNLRDAIDIIYTGIMKKKHIIIPGFRNKLLANLNRFFPRRLVTRVVGNMQKHDK